jgi:uncharacterized protein
MAYIKRKSEQQVREMLAYFPAVAIVGPRQVGKTSLAKHLTNLLERPVVYFDLEDPDDRAKFANPRLLLDPLAAHTVILDEIQRLPDLFPTLRGIIDRDRQPGRFVLLGSASPNLIRSASETLAGRIAYCDLTPFLYPEISHLVSWSTHLFRGGFHGSLLAPSETLAQVWRKNFISTYLERDLPMLGLQAEPTLTGKLWRMVAHLSGSVLNMETISSGLGISSSTVRRYLDFFESAYLIRRLPAYAPNLRKRLIRSPKIYLRDSGILHQLLGIQSFTDLSGHPIVGSSWEMYVIEQIAGQLPDWAETCYYRTHDGTEADLVLTRGGVAEILIEIKFSTAPTITKSLHIAMADLETRYNFIVCPIEKGFPLSENVRVIGLQEIHQIFEPKPW